MDTETNTPDTTILRKAGLTESQAKGYLALIEHGSLTPAELADKAGENRTNGYMICEKLENLGLASKKDTKKAVYTANHPSALETLAEKRRKVLVRNEQEVKQNIPSLIDFFYQYNHTPGVEFAYGQSAIEKIRARTLEKKERLYFVRSGADGDQDPEGLRDFIQKRVEAGIPAQSIASADHSTTSSKEKLDSWLMQRTLVPGSMYSAPVEIDIFGDTVAFVDFDSDGMSTMITSPNIAEAMRQLFLIAQEMTRQVVDQTAAREQLGQADEDKTSR